jgi:hypothetical protein
MGKYSLLTFSILDSLEKLQSYGQASSIICVNITSHLTLKKRDSNFQNGNTIEIQGDLGNGAEFPSQSIYPGLVFEEQKFTDFALQLVRQCGLCGERNRQSIRSRCA